MIKRDYGNLSLDSKGRMSFLESEREKLGERAVVVAGRNEIMFLTGGEWEALNGKITKKTLPCPYSEESRKLKRGFYSSVYLLNIDPQNRITIPQAIRP